MILEKSYRRTTKNKINSLPKEIAKNVEWIDNIKNLKNVFSCQWVLDAIPSKRFIKKDNNFEKVIKIKNDKLFYSLIDCEISHKRDREY